VNTFKGFVGGRIAEDERLAQDAIDGHEPGYRWDCTNTADSQQAARWNPWRVLTSCLSERLIIAAHRDAGPGVDRCSRDKDVVMAHSCSTCGQYDGHAVEWPCYTLRVMALIWVDHIDYRNEWRPVRVDAA
jgi:hypothetical protein